MKNKNYLLCKLFLKINLFRILSYINKEQQKNNHNIIISFFEYIIKINKKKIYIFKRKIERKNEKYSME